MKLRTKNVLVSTICHQPLLNLHHEKFIILVSKSTVMYMYEFLTNRLLNINIVAIRGYWRVWSKTGPNLRNSVMGTLHVSELES